ncbi:MAG: ABC transporter ATP-binding protein [Leptospiraceae bacterium]|nr:ABC transporter ATP-binding protein [Leptospiraceae bacterium]
MSMAQTAVQIENLVFGYKPEQPVLNISDLSINRGERVFIHGPSGSGKTTLLGLLHGVLAADNGRLEILGHNLTAMSGGKKDTFRGSHMGYIFQMFNLIPYLNVRENIVLPCRINRARHDRLQGRNVNDAAAELAEHLGIASFLEKDVTELSVGQQQRVAAARALIGGPEIIIADEPTSALDTDHRQGFLKLLFESCEQNNATLLFVSHDRGLAELFHRSIALHEINRVIQS